MNFPVPESVGADRPAEHPPIHVLFDQPKIPPNTGNAIRMCAGTGARLHLTEPLGFNFEERNVRRAGLDYHELADVRIHESFAAAADSLYAEAEKDSAMAGPPRIFAFTTQAETWYTDIEYRWGDVLLFGTEPTGLGPEVLADPRITQEIRIPLLPGRRSMNLSNAAAVAAYEAWRQLGFSGGE